MAANSKTFRKGDPRQKAAARKGGAARKAAFAKLKERKAKKAEVLTTLQQLQDMTPDVMASLKSLVKDKDATALRMVLDRTAPPASVQRLVDQNVANEIDALREENAELRRMLTEICGTPIKAA